MIQRFFLLINLFLLVVTSNCLYAQQVENDNGNQIFHSVSQTLKKNSFIGKSLFNDAFSGKLFHLYLNSLDEEHLILLQTDIDYLKKYALTLDDELNGNPPLFYIEVLKRYKIRVDEFEKNCEDILKKPFNLNNEAIDLQTISKTYPASSSVQKSKLKKYLMYEVLKAMGVLRKSNVNAGIANIQKQAMALVNTKFVNRCAKIKMGFSTIDFLGDYLKQVCLTVDPHTAYNTPKEASVMDSRNKGNICGVGMQLDEKNGYFSVLSLIKGGSALLSGKIKNGDLLLAIQEPGKETQNIAGWNLGEVIQRIIGEEDSEVILFFRNANAENFSVTLKRGQIANAAAKVRGFIIKKENRKTGYIVIPEFNNNVALDLEGQLIALIKEGVDGIVIDLRSNPGGAHELVATCAGYFIPQGPISQERSSKEGKVSVTVDRDPTMLYKGPLAILVSERSASASELFSSCLQDYNRAIIIGLPTLGKGSMFMSFSLAIEGESAEDIRNNKYGQLNITMGKYYRIKGPSVQLTGVIPDVIVPDYREMPQIRERKRPCALQADTVPPANYTYYNFGYDIPKAKRILNEQVKKDPQFAAIQKAKTWLQKQQTKPIPLNWEKFVAHEKATANGIGEAVRVSLLKEKLIVGLPTLKQQEFIINGQEEDEEDKAKLNKQWQEYLSGDVQLNLAVKAIKLMQK
ncbi:carboxy terminal-processing peptidase [Pedobacter nyackensis]|uniref:Carboxyl-terminal processing protease n=1 Tax=Pedobacter nyackensis TaxID=475255 RepID=A0A1W2ANM6_9SPHI|nr:carboxy terminal-processing peptidase [Pedobacter nyackensis]SMC62339.1 carboxyl-terminal processing protease [Pedobacter nyackensis]